MRLIHFDANPFDFLIEPAAANYPFFYDPKTVSALGDYLRLASPQDTDRVNQWLQLFWQPGQTVILRQLILPGTIKWASKDRQDFSA